MDSQETDKTSTTDAAVTSSVPTAPIVNDVQPPPVKSPETKAEAEAVVENTNQVVEESVSQNTETVKSAVVEEAAEPEVVEAPAEAASDSSAADKTPETEVETDTTNQVVEQSETPASDLTLSSVEKTPITEEATTDEPAANSADEDSKSSVAQEKPVAPSPVSANTQASAAQFSGHDHSRKLLVLVALIVGLVLAAAAVYIYMKSNSSSSPLKTSGVPTTTTVKDEDLNQTISDATNDLDSLNDAADFSDAAISDATLGL